MFHRFLCSNVRSFLLDLYFKITGYFIFLDANKNGIAFHFIYFFSLSLIYRNMTNPCILTLYPVTDNLTHHCIIISFSAVLWSPSVFLSHVI